jgi:hypothetical protein
VTVFWFGHHSRADFGLSVAPQNRREDEYGTGHESRSSSLLCVEASRTRVYLFASKLAEAQWWMVHVPPSWRSREDATDYVGPCYPYFIVFYISP